MVIYDSQEQVLQLSIRGFLAGTLATAIVGEISLKELGEPERQRLIAIAKLVISWANGHDVTKKRKEKKDGEEIELDSYLISTAAKIQKSVAFERKRQTPKETAIPQPE